METSKEILLNGRRLKFVNQIDTNDSSKIFTERYFYINVRGQKQPMVGKQKKEEYYSQLQIQIDFLQGKQLNSTMHIIDATNGVFHNYIDTEEDGIELRELFLNSAKDALIDYILVPDPNDIGGIGRPPKLVPLKSIK